MTTAQDRRPAGGSTNTPARSGQPQSGSTPSGSRAPSLLDLIREEDRKHSAIDPADELKRRYCPSGE